MRSIYLGLAFLVACGDDGGGSADATNVPAMVTVTGTATKREGTNTSPAVGVLVGAYKNSDPNTPVTTTMTDAQGMYTLTITTNGQALDGYLKATLAGFIDTYLYPPRPITMDFSGASLNILNTNTLDLLSNLLCRSAQMTTNGVVAVIVADSAQTAIAGATVSSSPAAAKYCYNSGGLPSNNATMTDTDGIAYMLNVAPGQVTVSAAGSMTFASHSVNARAGTFTTTLIQP